MKLAAFARQRTKRFEREKLQKFNAARGAARGEKANFEIWGEFRASIMTYFAQNPEQTL